MPQKGRQDKLNKDYDISTHGSPHGNTKRRAKSKTIRKADLDAPAIPAHGRVKKPRPWLLMTRRVKGTFKVPTWRLQQPLSKGYWDWFIDARYASEKSARDAKGRRERRMKYSDHEWEKGMAWKVAKKEKK
jgi:hypothetical protein